MRDINRIKPLLDLLEQYWNKNQDLRLGQILSNIGSEVRHNDDVFYMEDDIVEEWLKNKINKDNN